MSIIKCDSFSIDTDTKNCISEGKEVSLTKNEYCFSFPVVDTEMLCTFK